MLCICFGLICVCSLSLNSSAISGNVYRRIKKFFVVVEKTCMLCRKVFDVVGRLLFCQLVLSLAYTNVPPSGQVGTFGKA